MPNVDINYLAVVVAAVINMILGALWYSPVLFAGRWLKLVSIKPKDLKNGASTGYAIAALGFLLMNFVLAHFVSYAGAHTLSQGLAIGFWAWLGFVATTMAINHSFAGRPRDLWLIDSGYFLVCLLVNGALLAAW